MFTALLLASMMKPEISFIDSKDDSSQTWLLIEDCAVPLEKKKLNDLKYIEKEIDKICHFNIKLEDTI